MRHLIQFTVILASLLLIISNTSAQMVEQQADIFDIFPLKPNLHYTYNYYYESRYDEVGYLMESNTDSGIVEYIILDSVSANDSTIIWSLEERQSLRHKRFDIIFGLDSIYWTYDTIFLPLYENIYRNHELTSSGIVWDFPLTKPSILWSYPLTTTNEAVYRYSDTDHITVINQWTTPPGPPGYGADTLLFSETSGFYHRHQRFYGGQNDHWFSDIRVELQGNPTYIDELPLTIPLVITLQQNYPNPFNPSTQITFSVPKATNVTLKIYDVLGQEIAVLVNERKQAGEYRVTWNAESVPSGVYFYRIVAGEFVETKKMVLIR